MFLVGYIYWQPSSNELDAYIIGINSISYYTLHSFRFTRQRASNATQKVVNRNSKYLLAIEEWFNGLEELRKYTAFNKLNLVMQEVSKNLETSFVKRKK